MALPGQSGRQMPHAAAGESGGGMSRAAQPHHSHPVAVRKPLSKGMEREF